MHQDIAAETARRLYGDAVAALNRSDWHGAATMAARLLDGFGEHPGVHFVAGVAALEMRRVGDAIGHLSRSTAMNGGRSDSQVYLAKALAIGGDFIGARMAADRALALSPSDAFLLDTLGVVYTEMGSHEQAAHVFSAAVALDPDRANRRFNLASALLYAGDGGAAEREYLACLARDERFWRAYPALSSLRKQEHGTDHIDAWRHVLARHADDPMAQTYLNLALAKEYEDLGGYATAFAHYQASKKAAAAGLRYTPAQDAALFDALRGLSASSGSNEGNPSRAPIFVVGMPRSGTTLVDRILSSHPQVASAGELHQFPLAIKQACGSRTPMLLDLDTVRHSEALDWRLVGARYVESVPSSSREKARFVDKLPHNFLYVGHILQALPSASVICLRRHPLDTCLGNFRQMFSLASPFTRYSFDLLDIGRYYVLFDRLMAHWHKRFPGRVLEIRYEDLVEHQEATTRLLLEHCGLDWDAGCLDFHRNRSRTATASVVQVREPMQRGYMGRWRRYEEQLRPLKELLEVEGVALA